MRKIQIQVVKPQKVPLVFKKELAQVQQENRKKMQGFQILIVEPQKVPLVLKKELAQVQKLQQEHLAHQ